ncbi:hypothetical protein MCB86_17580, partial [Pseudomonas sp. KSR10]|uniref:hypothetical protein n=1 Tax=Pseudomonas sp. KSR10 TaxID=2916654 RepID=UPI001EF8F16C
HSPRGRASHKKSTAKAQQKQVAAGRRRFGLLLAFDLVGDPTPGRSFWLLGGQETRIRRDGAPPTEKHNKSTAKAGRRGARALRSAFSF